MPDEPIIYFDKIHAYGVANGTICLELSTILYEAESSDVVVTKDAPVAHLRCPQSTAVRLIHALQKAVDAANTMASPGHQGSRTRN